MKARGAEYFFNEIIARNVEEGRIPLPPPPPGPFRVKSPGSSRFFMLSHTLSLIFKHSDTKWNLKKHSAVVCRLFRKPVNLL